MNEPVKTFQVTDQHIENGRRSSRISCPIALALQEEGYLNVAVNNLNSFYYEDSEGYLQCRHFFHSEEVRSWINRFDVQGEAKPITIGVFPYEAEGFHGHHKLFIIKKEKKA